MSVILYASQTNKKDCGCSVVTKKHLPDTKTVAAMCQTCPNADRGINGGAVGCKINHKSIMEIVAKPSCPINRFSDGTNATQYVGLTWNGVPEPLRWRITHAKGRNVDLDGCGCVEAIKGSTFGVYVAPFFEGISQLREHYGNFLEEFSQVVRGTTATVAEL